MSTTAVYQAHSTPSEDTAPAEPRTLYELFRQVTTSHPDKVAFRLKRDGSWVDVTWGEHAAHVRRITKGLVALGVGKRDRVAILSGTRLEWVQCDSAIINSGAATVGIYPSNLSLGLRRTSSNASSIE